MEIVICVVPEGGANVVAPIPFRVDEATVVREIIQHHVFGDSEARSVPHLPGVFEHALGIFGLQRRVAVFCSNGRTHLGEDAKCSGHLGCN